MELIYDLQMTEQKTNSISNTVKQFGQKLFGFVRGKVKTNEDAEDILQDVWFQLSNFGNLGEIENVSAWLYQVARNKITDRYRKKTNKPIEDFGFENEDGAFDFKEILLHDKNASIEEKMFKDLFWKELMTALDELPEKQMEVFVKNEIEDKTLQQIADETGENLKTIISRKSYAVKYLREKLNYLYQELNY